MGRGWGLPLSPQPPLSHVEVSEEPHTSLCVLRVSLAELQTHPELDTDGDGGLSEEEAQVPSPSLFWDLQRPLA